ncbi:unannotated protein [freshwater metagenome]|uniref:Unannotated protein n=1 Tax=freshwater metagenome TaxID=449393 RepID=A0A6J7GK73_9ZZZZ
MDQHGGVAAVVQDHVRAYDGAGLVAELEQALGAPPVLLQRLALPGEHGGTGRGVDGALGAHGDGRGGVVLRGEDVAGDPADVGAQRGEGLDEDGGLHGHVQRTRDAGAGQGLVLAELGAQGHQARHLVLGERDLLAAEAGEGEVGDLEVVGGQYACACRGGHVAPECPGRARGAAAASDLFVSEHAEASAGLVPLPRLPVRRPGVSRTGGSDHPRYLVHTARRPVVARYRIAGPWASRGAPAGTKADCPRRSTSSPSSVVSTAVPSVHSRTWGPAVRRLPA